MNSLDPGRDNPAFLRRAWIRRTCTLELRRCEMRSDASILLRLPPLLLFPLGMVEGFGDAESVAPQDSAVAISPLSSSNLFCGYHRLYPSLTTHSEFRGYWW